MKTGRYLGLLLCVACGLLKAQQPDSAHTRPADTLATIQAFNQATGPAEVVFSFFSPPPYQFNQGKFGIGNRDFPLLNSPDSLVWQPIGRAHRRQRRAKIAAIVSAIPAGIVFFTFIRFLSNPVGSASGQSSVAGIPLRTAAITSLVGFTVAGTFNISSLINLNKGLKRHNKYFGRRQPTLFNPKGL